MTTLRYNEPETIRALGALPPELRVAFALLCAERLVGGYLSYCEETGRSGDDVLAMASRLWDDVEGEHLSSNDVAEYLDRCMALLRSINEDVEAEHAPFADDAIAALAYAFRARSGGDPQEAAWAARRSYESIDRFVINAEGIDLNSPGAEDRVLTHHLVQAELQRQTQNLADLANVAQLVDRKSALRDLRRIAREESARFFGG